VAISGDLTQRARTAQFTEARAFLDAVRYPLLVVPGNHDVPFYDIATRFLRPLARYRRFVAVDTEPMFIDGEMAALGLNSARSLTFGRGRLNAVQIDTATERLRGVPAGVVKIIVTHHPFDLPDDYKSKHLVGRAKMAMAALASAGADLFLAGHLHVSHIGRTAERYQIAGHSALVVQAGTLSTRERGEAGSFNVLRLERPRIAIERWTWDHGSQRFTRSAPRGFIHVDAGWIEEL
jgi:3',5'-cyclic AMP phosphodiesterase CpdA